MALYEPHTAPPAEPTIEFTINTKPANANDKKDELKNSETTATNPPKLDRKDSIESILYADEWVPRPTRHTRPVRRGGPRRFSPSPVRICNRPPPMPVAPLITSSTQLLDKVNYDGIADMPYPARSSVYLTTFPFTDRDVKKWSWLFAHGVEDVWFSECDIRNAGEDDEDEEDDFISGRGRGVRVYRNGRRDRSPFYNDYSVQNIPSVFLSRALNTDVIPESADNVKYFIVVRNKNRPNGGAKLLTAESRKAAGIMMFYEALTGNSTTFVGGVVGGVGKKARKFKKVEDVGDVDEAMRLSEEGFAGMIC